jgi:DNA-directed RNA polymerase specialized sigma24 family protein
MGVDPVRLALSTPYIQTLLTLKAWQLSRQPRFLGREQADLRQDLSVFVLRQAHQFDPSRASAQTFISRVVDSAFAMMVRARRRVKRAEGFRAISLEGTFVGGDRGGHSETLLDIIQEEDLRRRYGGRTSDDPQRTDLALDVSAAMAGLSPEHRRVALCLCDAAPAAVARQLGISRRQVRKAIRAIREHFENAGLRKVCQPGHRAGGRT